MNGVKYTAPGGVAYGVMDVPYRKKCALVRSYGVAVEPVAYFKSEEHAEQFLSWLDAVIPHTEQGVDE